MLTVDRDPSLAPLKTNINRPCRSSLAPYHPPTEIVCVAQGPSRRVRVFARA